MHLGHWGMQFLRDRSGEVEALNLRVCNFRDRSGQVARFIVGLLKQRARASEGSRLLKTKQPSHR